MKYPSLSRLRSLGVVGGNTLVGSEFVDLLTESVKDTLQIRRFAATDSWEDVMNDEEEANQLQPLGENSFDGLDAVFFACPPLVARKHAQRAVDAGCVVVDASGAFLGESSVPCLIPEINGAELREYDGDLVALPSCGATALALVLKPLHDAFGLKRVVVSTYQSASEAGKAGYEELSRQTAELLNGSEISVTVFAHPVAFNCVPAVGGMLENGSTDEEIRTMRELRQVLGLGDLGIAVSSVRVPTFSGYGATVNVELYRQPEPVEALRERLDGAPGVKVLDAPASHIYPTNRECTGGDFSFVGRLRHDESVTAGLSFWVMTDNLRKGTALNAIECFETIFRYRHLV